MSALTDELPTILIIGKYKARLITEWKQNGETQQSWAALPEIIALVAALPREQQDAVFGERWQQLVAGLKRADEQVSSLTAELGAVRAELERIRRLAAESAEQPYWLGRGHGDAGEHWQATLEEIASSGRSPEEKRDG